MTRANAYFFASATTSVITATVGIIIAALCLGGVLSLLVGPLFLYCSMGEVLFILGLCGLGYSDCLPLSLPLLLTGLALIFIAAFAPPLAGVIALLVFSTIIAMIGTVALSVAFSNSSTQVPLLEIEPVDEYLTSTATLGRRLGASLETKPTCEQTQQSKLYADVEADVTKQAANVASYAAS